MKWTVQEVLEWLEKQGFLAGSLTAELVLNVMKLRELLGEFDIHPPVR